MSKNYCVYILSSKPNGTLYTGVTDNLQKRVWEHKKDLVEGFTKKYAVHSLVYFEIFNTPLEAIHREKRLEKWKREWKIKLIKEKNSEWRDLYESLA